MEKALVRIHIPDERDRGYMLAELTGRVSLDSLAEYRYYYVPRILDQNGYPRCVGYAWRTFLYNGPLQNKGPNPTADEIYHYAQRHDAWPGEDYDGTSVRAGAKALVYYTRVSEYRWAFTIDDVLRWVLGGYGPLVLGTRWYEGMSRPAADASGTYWIQPTGREQGGHAYSVVGANRTQKKVRIVNNWGYSWGNEGKAWMSFDALAALLDSNGEAACAVEVGPA